MLKPYAMGPIRMITILVFTVLLINCSKNKTAAETPPANEAWPTEDIRTVRAGLNYPWEILWGKDDHLWITERSGRISKIDPKSGSIIFTATIQDVVARGEGGLLGMVQHPEFMSNGFLYVVYNYDKAGSYTEKVVRLKFSNSALTEPLVLIDNIPAASIHNGSRLLITADNKLMITTGDAANTQAAQDLNSLSGKILRINLDGTIPSDNPFPQNPVWSYGHRNPQGLVLFNDKLYASEHGPSIEDELNLIQKGRNYGWPNVNGPCDGSEVNFCTTNNVPTPVWSSGSSTIAVAGIDYYNNDRIGRWKNSILMTTLKDATLYQLKLNGSGNVESVTEFYRGNWGRLRDLCISPAGRIYICTSNGGSNDRIVEIQR
jgi:glucose/arabinose dehydrogenase